MQSSAAPNPQSSPSYSSRYPGLCWEQISILTGHSSCEGARRGFTPCPMTKYCLKVAESLHRGRATRIPHETPGQGGVHTPSSWDQQQQASPAPEETLRAWGLAARVALGGLSCPPAPSISQIIRLPALGQTLPPGPLKDREELRTAFLRRAVMPQVSTTRPIFTAVAKKKKKRKGECFCQAQPSPRYFGWD